MTVRKAYLGFRPQGKVGDGTQRVPPAPQKKRGNASLLHSGLFPVLHVFDDIGKGAFQGRANAVQNITVIPNHAVFILAVNGLEFHVGALGKLIPRDSPLFQITVYGQSDHGSPSFDIYFIEYIPD